LQASFQGDCTSRTEAILVAIAVKPSRQRRRHCVGKIVPMKTVCNTKYILKYLSFQGDCKQVSKVIARAGQKLWSPWLPNLLANDADIACAKLPCCAVKHPIFCIFFAKLFWQKKYLSFQGDCTSMTETLVTMAAKPSRQRRRRCHLYNSNLAVTTNKKTTDESPPGWRNKVQVLTPGCIFEIFKIKTKCSHPPG